LHAAAIPLTGATPENLSVDAAGFVEFGQDDMQSPQTKHIVAQFDT
jgi:hypothetical protein